MKYGIFATANMTNSSSTQENTTYREPILAGELRVEGWAIRKGYEIVFMEGHIYDEDDVLTATASSVGKVSSAAK